MIKSFLIIFVNNNIRFHTKKKKNPDFWTLIAKAIIFFIKK
jgi:hypothetical protein